MITFTRKPKIDLVTADLTNIDIGCRVLLTSML